MKLYIDTNVYRSYISSSSDIKSLEKLKKLIDKKSVELVFPSQTKKEFLKHFKEGIAQTKRKIKKATKFEIPNELKNEKRRDYSEQEKIIIIKIDELNNDLEKHRKQRIIDLKKHIKIVETLLNEIFQLATFFECTDDTVLKAVIRYAKDLPPKKNDHKFGDAIIWETLKENVRREEIVIISKDPDFRENKNKKSKSEIVISGLLSKEWKKHSGGKKITLYESLGRFVNTLDKKDKVSKETIKREQSQLGTLSSLHDVVFQNHNPVLKIQDMSFPISSGMTSNTIAGLSATNTENNEKNLLGSSVLRLKHDGNLLVQPETAVGHIPLGTICTRCHKYYTPNLINININGLCDECSSSDLGLYFTL